MTTSTQLDWIAAIEAVNLSDKAAVSGDIACAAFRIARCWFSVDMIEAGARVSGSPTTVLGLFCLGVTPVIYPV